MWLKVKLILREFCLKMSLLFYKTKRGNSLCIFFNIVRSECIQIQHDLNSSNKILIAPLKLDEYAVQDTMLNIFLI